MFMQVSSKMEHLLGDRSVSLYSCTQKMGFKRAFIGDSGETALAKKAKPVFQNTRADKAKMQLLQFQSPTLTVSSIWQDMESMRKQTLQICVQEQQWQKRYSA